MIANNSVRSAISFIHLAIGIFCISFLVMVLSEKAIHSSSFYKKKEFFSFLLLGILGISSCIACLSWQTTYLQISKRISYFIVVCFLLFYFSLFNNLNSSTDLLIAATVIFTTALFLFLLAFSKVGQLQTKNLEIKNDVLDSDFLISPDEEQDTISIFWKPNRIVSLSSFVFSILLFIFILTTHMPVWASLIPCTFLIGSIVLWIFPKIGSWIFAIVSSLAGIGIVTAFSIALIMKLSNSNFNNDLKFTVFFSLVVFSIFILCISMAMLLLSKEAKEEWKNKEEYNQNKKPLTNKC